jgi:predicted kinase
MSRPQIVLIRGLPCSGKSNMARQMSGYTHVESDMYLEVGAKHVYDPRKVRAAHDWCVAFANAALESGRNVVVSNTFAGQRRVKRACAGAAGDGTRQ